MKKSRSKRKTVHLTLGQEIKKVLVSYFATQFILMILVGFLTWLILSLLKVGYAIPLAVLTGVLTAVPKLGMLLATVITAVVAALDQVHMWAGSPAWLEVIIILVTFFIFDKLIDLIVAPLFLGKATKTNPLILMLVILLGTVLFQIPGAILSVPFYLVIKTIITHSNQI